MRNCFLFLIWQCPLLSFICSCWGLNQFFFARGEELDLLVLWSRILPYPRNLRIIPRFSILWRWFITYRVNHHRNLCCEASRLGSRLEIDRYKITAYWPFNSPEKSFTIPEGSSDPLQWEWEGLKCLCFPYER